MTQSAAFGTQLQVGDGATPTEVFTTIGDVGDISGPESTLDTIDVTTHSSPGAREEHIASILRSGDVSFPLHFDPTDPTHDPATGLYAIQRDRELRNYRLIWPDDNGFEFAAYVTGLTFSSPVTDARTADVTLKVTGDLEVIEAS